MASPIIRDGVVVTNDWEIISDASVNEIPTGKVILPLKIWNLYHDSLRIRKEIPGLWLNSDEHPAQFIGNLKDLPVVAVKFPIFTDGRGFSLGNLLRERYGYQGELRAHGQFIRDQLYYLKRCGFNAFEFETNVNLEEAVKSLRDFSDSYQIAADQAIPLFCRR